MSAKLIELNLLPVEEKERLAPASKKLGLDIPRLIPISLMALISVLVLISLLVIMFASSARQKLGKFQSKLAETKEMAEAARQLEKELPELRKQDEFFTAHVEEKVQCWKVIEQISVCCPELIKIIDMKISDSGKSKTLTIKGSYNRKGYYLEEQFRMNLENNALLKQYFGNFKAGQDPNPGANIKFTIYGELE